MIAVSRYFTHESCLYYCLWFNIDTIAVSLQTDVYKPWKKRFLPIFRNFSYELTNFLRKRFIIICIIYLKIFVIRKKNSFYNATLNRYSQICVCFSSKYAITLNGGVWWGLPRFEHLLQYQLHWQQEAGYGADSRRRATLACLTNLRPWGGYSKTLYPAEFR